MYTAIIWWWKVCLAVMCVEGSFSQIGPHVWSLIYMVFKIHTIFVAAGFFTLRVSTCFQGSYILLMATWKRFLLLYFWGLHTPLYVLVSFSCSVSLKIKIKEPSLPNNRVTAKFPSLKNYYIIYSMQLPHAIQCVFNLQRQSSMHNYLLKI